MALRFLLLVSEPGKTRRPKKQQSLPLFTQVIAILIQQDGSPPPRQLNADNEADFHSYGTEPAVGKAIKQSGIPREEIFVTSKLWNNKHHPEDVDQAAQLSLDDLGLEYLDLFLMHWPVAFKRGNDPFPSNKDGKLITDNIDYLDVSLVGW